MRITYSKKFSKQLKKSPKKIQKVFLERLELFIADPSNPLLRNHALSGNFIGRYSINLSGDWRLVYRKDGDEEITLLAIGTHSQLYK